MLYVPWVVFNLLDVLSMTSLSATSVDIRVQFELVIASSYSNVVTPLGDQVCQAFSLRSYSMGLIAVRELKFGKGDLGDDV